MEKQFVILYTNQKLKKAKTWHDGSLKHSGCGTKAVLFDDSGRRLDTIHVKIEDILIGEQLESDRYFILIEDLKTSDTQHTGEATSIDVTTAVKPSITTFSRARCAGLKRKNSGFMPPRVVKQACLRDSQIAEQECQPSIAAGGKPDLILSQQCSYTSSIKTSTSEFSQAIFINSPATNVGRNLISMYNQNGSSQDNSSQESGDGIQSIKRSSPWSVYGSKHSSPDMSALFRHAGGSHNLSENRTKHSSVDLNAKHMDCSNNVSDTLSRNSRSSLNDYEIENYVHSTDRSIYNRNVSNKIEQTIIEEDSKCHPDSNKEIGDTLKYNGKVEDLKNLSALEQENASIVSHNDLSNTIVTDTVPDKRNLFQIMKLLGKKGQSSDELDCKFTPCNEANQVGQFSGLAKTTDNLRNISKRAHQLDEIKTSSDHHLHDKCNDKPLTNENDPLTDGFKEKVDGVCSKDSHEEDLRDEFKETFDPSTTKRLYDENDALVNSIKDELNGATSEHCAAKKDTLPNDHREVVSSQLTTGEKLSDMGKDENSEDEDFTVSFHINFSPLSYVTDSDIEVYEDKAGDCADTWKLSHDVPSHGLLNKPSSVRVDTMTEEIDSDWAVSDKWVCNDTNEKPTLDHGLQSEQQIFCDVKSVSDLPDNLLNHSKSSGSDKLVDNCPNIDVSCYKSMTNNQEACDKLEDDSNELVDNQENFPKTSCYVGQNRNTSNLVTESDVTENKYEIKMEDNDYLLDSGGDIDQVKEDTNESLVLEENERNSVEKNYEEVKNCESMVDNSESTIMPSQDTMEFSINTVNSESQGVRDVHRTEDSQHVTENDSVTNGTKVAVSQVTFGFSSCDILDSQYTQDSATHGEMQTGTKPLNSYRHDIEQYVDTRVVDEELLLPVDKSRESLLSHTERKRQQYTGSPSSSTSGLSMNLHSAQRACMRTTNQLSHPQKQTPTFSMDDIPVGDEDPLEGLQDSPHVIPPHPRLLFGKRVNRTQNNERQENREPNIQSGFKSSCRQEHFISRKLDDYSLPYVSSARVSKIHHTRDPSMCTASIHDVDSVCEQEYRTQPNSDSTRYNHGNMLHHSPFQTLSDSDTSGKSTPYLYSDMSCFKASTDDFSGEEYSSLPWQVSNSNHERPLNGMQNEKQQSQTLDDEEIYQQLYQPRIMYLRTENGDNVEDDGLAECTDARYNYESTKSRDVCARSGGQSNVIKPGVNTGLNNRWNNIDVDSTDYFHQSDNRSDTDVEDSDTGRCCNHVSNLNHQDHTKIYHKLQIDGENSRMNPPQHPPHYLMHQEHDEQFANRNRLSQEVFDYKSSDVEESEEVSVNGLTKWKMFLASQNSDDNEMDLVEIADKLNNTDKGKEFSVLQSSPGLYNTQRNRNVQGSDSNSNSNWNIGKQFVNVQSAINKTIVEREGKKHDQHDIHVTMDNSVEDTAQVKHQIPPDPSRCVRDVNDKIVGSVKDVIHGSDQNSESFFSCDSFDDMLETECFDMDAFNIPTVRHPVAKTTAQKVPEIERNDSSDLKITEENNVKDSEMKQAETIVNSSEKQVMFSRIGKKDFEEISEVNEYSEKDNFENLRNNNEEIDDNDRVSKVSTSKTNCKHSNTSFSPIESPCLSSGHSVDSMSSQNAALNILSVDEKAILIEEETVAEDSLPFSAQNLGSSNRIGATTTMMNGSPAKDINGQQNFDKKNNTIKFSLDESLDLSFDSDISAVSESNTNVVCTKKTPPTLRIGWKPPVKQNVTNKSQDSTNDSEGNKENDSHKVKPTFKCLRLMNDRKLNPKLPMVNMAIPEKHNVDITVDSNLEITKSDNDCTNTLTSPSIVGVSKVVDLLKTNNCNTSQTNIPKQDQQYRQAYVANTSQRFQLPSRNSPVTSNVMKCVPKVQAGQSISQTELRFPSKSETDKMQNVVRQVAIPATFSSVNNYKHIITAALTEYINSHLLDVARRYHHALSKVDTSTYCETQSKLPKSAVNNPNPVCQCGVPSKMVCVKKEGPNCGRYFYACSANRNQQCKYFQWADENRRGGYTTNSRRKICDVGSVNQYMKSQHVPFYGECQIVKRTKENINKYFKAPKWMRNKGVNDGPQKKQTFLKLPYKGRSSMYAKDDIWVVSHQLDFNPTQTFIAKSTYYGPSSSQEVEIEPIAGYSPSNWPNGGLCHAILATNASTELSCLDNIREHIQAQSPPVLPHLMNRKVDNDDRIPTSSKGFQAPRSLSGLQGSKNVHLHCEQLDDMAHEYINRYRLNTDQAEALWRVANMFSIEKSPTVENVLLIHGVFGAGKSFLLSVMVLFLVEVFHMNDSATTGQPFPWKLLISSTTNVAVDRILNGLLDLGFEDFVRVGSVKKIAKPVLPYSVHASGTDNQELKDLQEMLRSGELTNAEKSNVRQSIEKHRRGENKKKLGRVRVVGATCAACSLTCLNQMEFPLVLLDECSQMTEPASLLPVAKFGCQKLLLVGDPKQLDPTIQGCEAAHRYGLEQTLFDRLINMGCMPTLLRTQYRCHPNISAISNSLFYGGMLEDGVTVEQRKPLLDILPTVCCYDVDKGRECCESFGSYYNECEAEFVVFLLKVLLTAGVEPTSVGVITLYKSQMSRISDLLTGQGDAVVMKGIQVSTVDAFQGGERDIIILSTVRTDACGFIDNDKRMNVALTRAKHHLLIVGNVNNLSRNLLWSKVLEHCKSNRDGIQSVETSQTILQDYLESEGGSNVSQCSQEISSGVSGSLTDSVQRVQKKRGRKSKKGPVEGRLDKENYKTVFNVETLGSIDTAEVGELMDEDFEYKELNTESPKLEDDDFQSDTDKLLNLPCDGRKSRKRKRIADKFKSLLDDSDGNKTDEDLPPFDGL